MAIIGNRTHKIRVTEGMYMHKTCFTDAGDRIARRLTMKGLSVKNYKRRHVVLSGGFGTSFPNTDIPDQIGHIGAIWPYDVYLPVDQFEIYSLEPNSCYLCIVPTQGYKIVHQVLKYNANDGLQITKGKAYIPTVSYTIDGEIRLPFTAVVCKNQEKTISLDANGSVMIFWAIAESLDDDAT
jgi:hypothetical protein